MFLGEHRRNWYAGCPKIKHLEDINDFVTLNKNMSICNDNDQNTKSPSLGYVLLCFILWPMLGGAMIYWIPPVYFWHPSNRVKHFIWQLNGIWNNHGSSTKEYSMGHKNNNLEHTSLGLNQYQTFIKHNDRILYQLAHPKLRSCTRTCKLGCYIPWK